MTRSARIAGGAAVVLLLMLGCASTGQVIRVEGVMIEQAVTYSAGPGFELKLAIARRESGHGPFPALVFLYGNGWGYWAADRMDYQNIIIRAAQRGYVAASIDYRATSAKEDGKTKFLFPAQLHDAKAAVRWLRGNAKKYKIDPNRIGAAGYSSGGHLALLLGLTTPSDGLEGESVYQEYSSSVQAVVNAAGPTDLTDMYNESPDERAPLADLMGGSPQALSEQYAKASPLTYVRAGAPPILTIQGGLDRDVPPQQAYALDARMKQIGATHILVVKSRARHEDFLSDPQVLGFFDKFLGEPK